MASDHYHPSSRQLNKIPFHHALVAETIQSLHNGYA